MKLLHLLGDPADLGGILSVIRGLHEVGRRTATQHVVVVHAGYRETRRPALEYRYSNHLLAESPHHLRLFTAAFPAVFELRRLTREEPFDLIHAHTRGALPVAMLLASVYRQPVACTHHTYARRTRLYRWASRLPRFHTVVLTPNMARHYRLTVNPPRVSVISACCAEALFEFPLERRVRSRSAGQPLRLVGAGNLVRWKRWHLMLDAFARLSPSERTQLHFTHFGEAPPDPDSMAYAQSLHHRVRSENLESCIDFAGPSLDAPQRIREADWFVLPSTNEPCSVALIEALALGKPALVSASGGNLDIVTRDRTGLLFKPDDPEDLVRNLRRIVANAIPLADPLEIRQSVAHRRASVVAGLYQELYERIVSGSIARHTPAATP